MDAVNRKVNTLKKEVLYFHELLNPLVIEPSLKELISDTEFGETGNVDETYLCLTKITEMFEKLLTMKNNEEYVQEAANQSPSIHDINTNKMMSELDICSYMVYDYVKKNPDNYKSADLQILSDIVKSDDPLSYQEDIVPGSSNVFDDKNLTMMILDDKVIKKIPKNATVANFEIENSVLMIYDFSTLVDTEVINNLNIKMGEGLNKNVVSRFKNFTMHKHKKGKNVTTVRLLEGDVYLKFGDNYRKILDYPEWDIKNSSYVPQLVFRNDMENKRLIMSKTNMKKRYRKKLVTAETLGSAKNKIKMNGMHPHEAIYDEFSSEITDDEGMVRLISFCGEVEKKKIGRDYHKFFSEKRNFKDLNNI